VRSIGRFLEKGWSFGGSEGIPQSDAPDRSIRIIAWDAIHAATYFADNEIHEVIAQYEYVVRFEHIEYYDQ
jgi:hypothetical protein